jgi:peptide/nickel transport system permease protein
MAYAEGSRFDVGTSSLSILLTSIPFYVFAIVALYLFAYQAGLFPTSGAYDSSVTVGLNVPFLASALHHAALPLFTLVVTGFGGTALSMRGNSIHVLGADYMRVADLRGLSDRVIALRYVGRNAILPMYTGLMISIGGLFGGSVIFEEIFRYPGVGFFLFNATTSRDYPLMMGGFLFITTLTVLGILFADLTYGLVDPRAGRGGGDRESY